MKVLAGGALALLFAACGSTPDRAVDGMDASASVTFADVMALTRVRCHPCHTTQGLGGFLDFGTSSADDARAFASLVSPAKGSLCADQDFFRVVPGDPGKSLLIAKLDARRTSSDPPCGGGMPTGDRPALPAEEIALLRRWIAGGAPGPR